MMTKKSEIAADEKLIYHITTKSEWNEALVVGLYKRSTRGKSFDEVGFIHASLPRQVARVAEFVYGNCDEELVLLAMDLDRLTADGLTVRFEDGGNGEFYPHIYSPLLCRLIDEVIPAGFDEKGRFVFTE